MASPAQNGAHIGHAGPEELLNRFAHSAGPYCAPLSTDRVVFRGAEL